MSRLRIVPIVEGHGEVDAIRILLRRIWYELLGGEFVDILQPIRQPRDRLVNNKDRALEKAIDLAVRKLRNPGGTADPEMVLILVDANSDLPCELGPKLLETARKSRADQDITCVLANVEYESWFVAAASSLSEYLDVSDDAHTPSDPESSRSGKSWIQQRFKRAQYSETVDQPKLTAKMDLNQVRRKSPSFNKLCRELEKRCKQPPA